MQIDNDYTLLIYINTICLLIFVLDDITTIQFDLSTIGQLYFTKYKLHARYKHRQTYLIIITSNLTRVIGTYLYILLNHYKKSIWDIVSFIWTIFEFFIYILDIIE